MAVARPTMPPPMMVQSKGLSVIEFRREYRVVSQLQGYMHAHEASSPPSLSSKGGEGDQSRIETFGCTTHLTLKNHLSAMEALRPTSGGVGFNAAQTKQAEKKIFRKPLFVSLGAEILHKP